MDMDIHAKSVDMDMDMGGKFHIHGNPGKGHLTPSPCNDVAVLGYIFLCFILIH